MHFSVTDLKIMAENMAESKMFRYGKTKTPMSQAQVFSLMMLSSAEGRHPALGLKDYDLIDGKPAKKTEAMLRDFQEAGGSVEWHSLSDIGGSATFSHPQGGSVKIDWNVERAKRAGLLKKDVWQQYPRSMYRSRIVSEGVRTVCPAATGGMYNTEEMQDMTTGEILSTPGAAPEFDLAALDAECERLAADVAASTDLAATYLAYGDLVAKIEKHKPEYMQLVQQLFETRGKELEDANTAEKSNTAEK